jgi:hypothetical protein
MAIRGGTVKAFALLICIAACANGAALRWGDWSLPASPPSLRFAQTIALSDFDADGLIDQARIANWGSHRSVRVVLSRSGKRLTLHLDDRTAYHGSLFASDVDKDGAADLIWTDLLHAECVVVWRGTGNGEFVRAPAGLFAGGYTLPGQGVNNPDETIRETSIGSETNRSSEAARSSINHGFLANQLPQPNLLRLNVSSHTLGEPSDRGPPLPRY